MQSSNLKKGAGFFNRNSAAIDSLVSYILDTKPYHSKLSEIVEEYQFSEKIHVTLSEQLRWFNKFDSHWGYQYVSSANPNLRLTPINKILSYLFQDTTYKVGQDENQDLTKVPFAYSKRHFDGAGVAKVRLVRGESKTPLVESVDFHQSLGSFEFQIKQTFEVMGENDDGTVKIGDFNPLWQTTQDHGSIASAINTTIKLALDETNPRSPLMELRGIIKGLIDYIVNNGVDAPVVMKELKSINDTLFGVDEHGNPLPSGPMLPYVDQNPNDEHMIHTPYTFLFDAIKATPALLDVPEFNIEMLGAQFQYWSPPLYFIPVTDKTMYETGKTYYRDTRDEFISLSDVVVGADNPPQDWIVKCIDVRKQQYSVTGSVTGFLGTFVAGKIFNPKKLISFKSTKLKKAPFGSVITITPYNRISVAYIPPVDGVLVDQLETWNLIKTNPIAHNRPLFNSERIGKIYNAAGEAGYVDFVSPTVPKTSIVVEFTGSDFKVTYITDPTYIGTAYINQVFTDDNISFTIKAGETPFRIGDKFIIDVINEKPFISELGISLGFDVDAFDNDHLLDTYGDAIGYYFDTRFPFMDMSELNVTPTEYVKHKRQWRLEAIPDKSKPISTIKKDGSGPSPDVDLDDATSGEFPDPALDAPPVYTRNADGKPDLTLYYASSFNLTYSDDNYETAVYVQTLPAGGSFHDDALGISFNVPLTGFEGKPFLGCVSRTQETDTTPETFKEFGDIISFISNNDPPTQVNVPAGLFSDYLPRLNPFSSGFFYAPAANWEVVMLSPVDYTITAIHTSGDNNGKVVSGYPRNGCLALDGQGTFEGLSYKDELVHFSIEVGDGLAAGDKFVFETYDRKPTFLVHGSESGYQEPAVVGEHYWNGLIAFKIDKPSYYITDGTSCADNPDIVNCVGYGRVWAGDDLKIINEHIRVNRIRVDHNTDNYTITRNGDHGYVISHQELGVIGRIAYGGGIFNTDQIEIEIIGTGIDKYFGDKNQVVISVTADGLQVFNSRDLVIINSITKSLNPVAGDDIVVTKTLKGGMEINITPGTAPIADLMPEFINVNLIDIDTRTPSGLKDTSPDALILNGWIPTIKLKWDSTTSIAEFYDQATTYEYFSAGTGERMGQTVDLPVTHNEKKTFFEWDANFIQTHLPTNAIVNFVTNNQGWRDTVSVFMNESVKYISGSYGGNDSFKMTDAEVGVKIFERKFTYIDNTYAEKTKAVFDDTFDGFMPGFGNVLFDAEDPVFNADGSLNEAETKAFFDAGSPINLESLMKRFGSTERNKKTIFKLWDFYLREKDGMPTTTEDWEWLREKLKVDIPHALKTVDEFGSPYKGLAMDSESAEVGLAVPAIFDESKIVDQPLSFTVGFDGQGFDNPIFDAEDLKTLNVSTYKKPALSPTYQAGMDWDSFEGYFDTGTITTVINGVATDVDLNVDHIILAIPDGSPVVNIDVWYADNKLGGPSRATPEQVASNIYHINIPRQIRVKLDVYQ